MKSGDRRGSSGSRQEGETSGHKPNRPPAAKPSGAKPRAPQQGKSRSERPATRPPHTAERAPVQAPRAAQGRPGAQAESAGPSGEFQRIYGKHPVREALSGDRAVYRLWLAQNLTPAVVREFRQLAREREVPVQLVPHPKLEALLAQVGPVNHQGIVAEIGAYDYADWGTWLTELKAQGEQAFVLILDQLQDPHNFGAILRTAEAAGVHGVVIPKHGGVGLSETVAKASAGAIEAIPVLQVTNLARSLEELKTAGLWVMGLSANQGENCFAVNLKGPIALVIGSEHKGLRPNIEDHCDVRLKIPMHSERSLNASVAAAVAMYEVVRQRQSG